MEQQLLSHRLDILIAELLEQKRRERNTGRKKIRVVITGNDTNTLPATLLSLVGLERAGYQLWVTFSYSARVSGLKAACISEIDAKCSGAVYSEQEPMMGDDEYSHLFLPAISTNSLGKIALCIRDNIASAWVFHALERSKRVIVTLNPEWLNHAATEYTRPLQNRFAEYVATLEQYGIKVMGKRMFVANTPLITVNTGMSVSLPKKLVTLSDILMLSGAKNLRIDNHTLITPAAQDEIRRQNITIIQGF